MDTYTCTCKVYDYYNSENAVEGEYVIKRVVEAKDEVDAQNKLIDWIMNLFPEADVDEIEIEI